jgi:putative sensor
VAFQDIPMAPMDSNKVISDDIVTVSDAMNEKRKSFFGRLFS